MVEVCNACNRSSITFGNAADRSVTTSSGSPYAAIAVVENVRAATKSRRDENYTSTKRPYPSRPPDTRVAPRPQPSRTSRWRTSVARRYRHRGTIGRRRLQRCEPLHPAMKRHLIPSWSRSATSSSRSRDESPNRRYQRTPTRLPPAGPEPSKPLTTTAPQHNTTTTLHPRTLR